MKHRAFRLTEKGTLAAGGDDTVPLLDLGEGRNHHARCLTHPGEPLDRHSICCDCVYGAVAEREEKQG